MPKGYWVIHADITDKKKYAAYRVANAVAFHKYGGRFIIRAGRQEIVEGQSRSRNTLIEFPSFADARDCYYSAEYQSAKAIRKGALEIDIVVVEGYEGPQP